MAHLASLFLLPFLGDSDFTNVPGLSRSNLRLEVQALYCDMT